MNLPLSSLTGLLHHSSLSALCSQTSSPPSRSLLIQCPCLSPAQPCVEPLQGNPAPDHHLALFFFPTSSQSFPVSCTNVNGSIFPFEILFVISHICVLPAPLTHTLFDNSYYTLYFCLPCAQKFLTHNKHTINLCL